MIAKIRNFLFQGARGTVPEKKLSDIEPIKCQHTHLPCAGEIQIDEFIQHAVEPSLWTEIERTIESLNLPDHTGGVNRGDQRAIFNIAYGSQAESILEIGTHIGCSTIHFALAQKALNQGEARLTTVDIRDVNSAVKKPWLEFNSPDSPSALLEKIGCREQVAFKVGNSTEFMATTQETYDLIFLDGSHLDWDVYLEVPVALKVLKPGGILLLHDYFPGGKSLWPSKPPIMGPYTAINRFIQEGNPLEVVPLGDLPWETKLNSNTTSLAILAKTC